MHYIHELLIQQLENTLVLMKILKTADDFISKTNTTQILDDENNKIDVIIPFLFLSTPSGVLFLSLLSFLIWIMIKILLNIN